MRKLTVRLLDRHNPCPEGRELFVRLFPGGTYCSKRDIQRMVYLHDKKVNGIDGWVSWAAHTLLMGEAWEKYIEILESWHKTGESKSTTRIRAFGIAWRMQDEKVNGGAIGGQ